ELERVRQEQMMARGDGGGHMGGAAAATAAAVAPMAATVSSEPHHSPQLQAVPSAGQKPEWYLAINDEQIGPVTLDEVQMRWDRGEAHPNTLAWRAGLADWATVSAIGELSFLLNRPQAGGGMSKAAAVAAEVAKPAPEPEKPKEVVTWRP